MPAKDLAEEIYQTLSKQSFVDWYEKSFVPHIEGEAGYKLTDVIKEEIRELFNVKPETQKRFIVVDEDGDNVYAWTDDGYQLDSKDFSWVTKEEAEEALQRAEEDIVGVGRIHIEEIEV